MKDYIKDEIEFNCDSKLKRSKNLLSELDEIDECFLPSTLYNKTKDDKKTKDIDTPKKIEENSIDDDWMATLYSFKAPKTKKKSKSKFRGFEVKKEKKNKDKKNKGDIVNHKKEFEPEMILLRNLQIEQDKFVSSLQKKYDQLESTKSSARGVGKFTTDLINSITSARSVSMQLVDKIISTKKTIADLNIKERKEFGSSSNSEQQNMTDYASTYLKQVMNMGRNNLVGQQHGYTSFDNDHIEENDLDDLFSSIDSSLGDVNRSEESEKYLKYENDNVEVKVYWDDTVNSDDIRDKYEFVALNKYGDIVDDYPLPEKTKLNINRSTGSAIDMYGNKYKLIIK